MIVKDIIFEDFINYKKPSMFIICPKCSFKCDIENGNKICQNSNLVNQPSIELTNKYIVDNYINNNITGAIVFGGLEPFDTFADLLTLIHDLRKVTEDDIVIYTGYNKEEIEGYINMLSVFKNIIIKFGRFIPNNNSHYDNILGINLSSDNQYAEKISLC